MRAATVLTDSWSGTGAQLAGTRAVDCARRKLEAADVAFLIKRDLDWEETVGQRRHFAVAGGHHALHRASRCACAASAMAQQPCRRLQHVDRGCGDCVSPLSYPIAPGGLDTPQQVSVASR